jgi:surface antigen
VTCAVALAATLGGCLQTGQDSNETYGQLLGGGVGSVLGGLVGNQFGGTAATLIGVGVGTVAGVMIGGSIGASLDQRDRELAAAATYRALEAPTVTDGPPVASRSAPRSASKPAAKPAPSKSVAWQSERDPNVRGTSTVTGSQVEPSGETCKTVREVAYIQGQEVVQQTQYCRAPGGSGWTREA